MPTGIYPRKHPPRALRPVDERFWSKVNKTETCWNWKGAQTDSGYAQFLANGKIIYVHRFSYESLVGPIPDGLTVDHLCRNRVCVNPDHLEVVSMKENILRGQCPPANNARKTHCPKGHPLEGDNLTSIGLKLGKRKCKICQNERTKLWLREYRRKQREAKL